jgi:long-subunit acyl-CoA synthetase (AMP-forming)
MSVPVRPETESDWMFIDVGWIAASCVVVTTYPSFNKSKSRVTSDEEAGPDEDSSHVAAFIV